MCIRDRTYKVKKVEIIDYPHKESNPFKNESPYEFIERNTKEKSISAFAYLQENQQKILPVLTADTIVSLDDRIFGKPENKDHAISMLLELSGQFHNVISCVAIGIMDKSSSDTVNFYMDIVAVSYTHLTLPTTPYV